MRFRFPSGAKRKPSPTNKPPSALSDVVWTFLLVLKESADAFPPLKSAVAGVVAVCDIAERAKHSKADARDMALRTKVILDVIAEAVPDGSAIPPPMLASIERFTTLLDEIQQGIRAQLDDVYRDFVTASALRLEIQHARLTVEQKHTQLRIGKVAATTDVLVLEVSRVLFYSRLIVFLAVP
ncbi:hypothetical protein DFH09DRAFT_1086298 [Mycena vulgaris]|nr:hypothetical protein DFH09DRAFT_1086298 [Mycena vulgaris]